MKKIFFVLSLTFCVLSLQAQNKENKSTEQHAGQKKMVVEAACGQCQFGLPGKDCDLAVRINGKAYFVDGTDIDAHGDAHAKDGFCQAIRKAEVEGNLVNNRFKVSSFVLLPKAKEKK